MFETGDAVAHPVRGAGVVAGVEQREWRESSVSYYKIELVDPPGTDLWIPTSTAEERGLRRALSHSELDQVWRVLRDEPKVLPENPKERLALLEQLVSSGLVLQIAEALRDISWRGQQRKLRAASEQLFERGMRLIGGEIAIAQGISMTEAQNQIHAQLQMADSEPPQ